MSEPVKHEPHVVRVISSVAANTATIAGSVFNINPSHSSTVYLYTVDPSAGGGNEDAPAAQPMRQPMRRVDLALFNFLTRGVVVIAVVCLLLEFATGFTWPEPTAAQANIISAVDFGWKTGFGVVVGLMTGKSFVP